MNECLLNRNHLVNEELSSHLFQLYNKHNHIPPTVADKIPVSELFKEHLL